MPGHDRAAYRGVTLPRPPGSRVVLGVASGRPLVPGPQARWGGGAGLPCGRALTVPTARRTRPVRSSRWCRHERRLRILPGFSLASWHLCGGSSSWVRARRANRPSPPAWVRPAHAG